MIRKNLCLFFTFFIALSTMAQPRKFDSVAVYPLHSRSSLFQVSDITGDGIRDITAIYPAEDKFGIFAGHGDGGFASERLANKDLGYAASDIADLNGDGYPELVISSYWDNGFKIYFGSASGNFAQSLYMATGVHGREIKCVDINKDGKTDILAITSGSGQTISLHVFINRGDGTFWPKKTFPSMLDASKEIAITDKNGDGLPDVVVSSFFPSIVFFIQQPDGSFIPNYWYTFTNFPPVFGDLDRDNKEDMVLLYPSFDNAPGSDSMIIRLNAGDSSFSPSIRVQQFEGRKIRPYRAAMADIDLDGYPDFFMDHLDIDGQFTDTVWYMHGQGSAGFDVPAPIKMPAKVLRIKLADMDSDGYADLVASCDNNTICIAFNKTGFQDPPVTEIQVYPNPARSNIFIKGLNGPYTVRLYNAQGSLLKETISANTILEWKTASLPAGMYYIEVINKQEKTIKPLVIQ